MLPVYFIDFRDSFSFNILAELESATINYEFIPFEQSLAFLTDLVQNPRECLLLLGPGPGHPQDYQEFCDLLKLSLKIKKIRHMGICLGHQLIWTALGHQVQKSQEIKHGESVSLNLPHWWQRFWEIHQPTTFVQRYNSLAISESKISNDKNVKTLWQGKDLMASANKKQGVLTYQFHPESIGTSFPKKFFTCMNSFFDL
jgi:anthranilate/para-aminobenzoate synthase component II